MESLSERVAEHGTLTEQEKQAMYKLYNQYYGASNYELFIRDLIEKDYVILFNNADDEICGFSTLAIIEFKFEGRKMRAIFSGDTIIHHDYWGSQILSLSWCRLAGVIKAQYPDIPLYWFLIVKGYRTYRYLPLFAKIFYPTWRHETPAEIQSLMSYLASRKFNDAYLEHKGIIRFDQSQGHLQGGWADIPDHVNKNPDVRYFLEKNPGYINGEELVCLTELHEGNLRSFALRAFRQTLAA